MARDEARIVEVMSRPAQELPTVPSRSQQAQRLIRDHPRRIEADPAGEPIVRGQVLAIAPSPAALSLARRAGFRVGRAQAYGGLGLEVVVLTAPRGMPATEAAQRLRTLDPQGQYEFNHLYQQGGAAALAAGAAPAAGLARVRPDPSIRVGLVDGAVARGHPTLAGAKLVQKAFVPGKTPPTAHATAVASLIAGAYGPFRGAAPGATVYVADVYGATPTGGSVEALVRGLAWLAENHVPVINVSLVGPPNRLLAAAIQSLTARGHVVVAAVGNDGAAAGPLYPAAYPGVVAVTAVDARRRALPEAVRGPHVDFAAPGADMAAGGLAGFVKVRGTSFAAPIAAGRLARMIRRPDPAAAARAVAALGEESTDLGVPGPDPVYGKGLVAFELRTDPLSVGAQRTALRGP
ncbi:S8 family serine peptidase [Phenylobacterium sp.]|uniref:S8 family serine peptidase n=1 Tax=Phenylobacterium sp. TaxID=1871053 RepID=UPI002FDFF47D